VGSSRAAPTNGRPAARPDQQSSPSRARTSQLNRLDVGPACQRRSDRKILQLMDLSTAFERAHPPGRRILLQARNGTCSYCPPQVLILLQTTAKIDGAAHTFVILELFQVAKNILVLSHFPCLLTDNRSPLSTAHDGLVHASQEMFSAFKFQSHALALSVSPSFSFVAASHCRPTDRVIDWEQ